MPRGTRKAREGTAASRRRRDSAAVAGDLTDFAAERFPGEDFTGRDYAGGDLAGGGSADGDSADEYPSSGESVAGDPGGGRSRRGGGSGTEDAGGEEAARAVCLRLLTNRPRTRAELATALRRRRIPDDVAESVLGRFAEVGLIDDAAFARAWVESRHHSRGLARRVLEAELRQRGIPDGEVRSAVGMLGPQDEIAAARRLVAKRVAATRGQPGPARARQLLGMLARKGYSAGLATQVVREALDREAAEGSGGGGDLAWIWQELAGDEWP